MSNGKSLHVLVLAISKLFMFPSSVQCIRTHMHIHYKLINGACMCVQHHASGYAELVFSGTSVTMHLFS